ncbi:outer membrane beta-barrel protein [Chitinophaga ginsengisegetis]|uniref:outer membrane beta-barrel protein n=1 Tax=Chitinophaga ginsengisegetis TaxID=393003 RepID=UPI000DB9599E|nr:outer membrane beta-barrel protein [Chitinophaga ginsengisegetis]MDR6566204.1 cytoskeletal protein RodZ [Chitinophaga ginsengisegetis]MDR6645934.1 cytoskeletal protein RodZ [Chitinophaga ginsengisegetis]MDR6651474.1 cytoskeletal protein RodZ [Chitinophaga ginsengisegetis]
MNDAFENSIRNKLNEADIPFDQDAWKKMESKLDAGDNNKRPAGWWWLLLLPVLGGLGWWIMQPSATDKTVSRATVASPQQQDSVITNGQRMATPDSNAAHLREIPTPTKIHQGSNSSLEKQQPAANTTTGNSSQQQTVSPSGIHLPKTNAAAVNTGRQQTSSPADTYLPKANKTTDQYIPEKRTIPDIPVESGKTTGNDNGDESTIKYSVFDLLKTKSANNYNVYTKIGIPREIPINNEIQPDQEKKVARRKINSKGLYVGVTFGPDLNVAPSFNYGKIGFNAGVLAHYYFNKHWFVTSGVVYSKKLYGATSSDYRNPNYTNPYDLVKVNANCDVLDIPVNINYTFLQVKNNTVSATLGISNYIMLKEKYQYIYKYTPEKERTVENENQHYLAILNVGALYQHPAGRRLIVGVQPYAKIPLHGVGLGQVKLYSAGLSLQLNLVGKKR